MNIYKACLSLLQDAAFQIGELQADSIAVVGNYDIKIGPAVSYTRQHVILVHGYAFQHHILIDDKVLYVGSEIDIPLSDITEEQFFQMSLVTDIGDLSFEQLMTIRTLYLALYRYSIVIKTHIEIADREYQRKLAEMVGLPPLGWVK